jgi:uncharacterized protein (TIGR01777 family)
MKVLLTGASGFIGSQLSQKLVSIGHRILSVGRSAGSEFNWSDASLREAVQQADGVIHLAGENLFSKRWSAKQKEILRTSRIDSTRKLASLVASRKPSCFISASAVGYYGPHESGELREASPHGHDFLANLCADWESATSPAAQAGVRTAIVRTGVVLGTGGGALSKMLLPFKLGLGGPLGNGKQWVSWVHINDVTALYVFLLENASASGPFNACAPQPVTMKDFAKALGRALHRPAVFPVPAPMLRLALGEVADVLLTGQCVIPQRALDAGFQFQFRDVQAAFEDIVRR